MKKEETINFQTKCNVFVDGIELNRQKLKLYEKATKEQLAEELKTYGIDIREQEVVEAYRSCYSFQNLLDDYYKKYQKEMEYICSQETIFDDDCLYFYFDKIIDANFDVTDVPDCDYISLVVQEFDSKPDAEKPGIFLKVLRNVNQMKQYTTQRNLNAIFAKTLLDMEFAISDILGVDMQNLSLDYETAKSIVDEALAVLDMYECEHPEYIYGEAMELLAKYGFCKVENMLKEGLRKYPNHQLRMYYHVLFGLSLLVAKNESLMDFLSIYDEAMAIFPVPFEEEYHKLIVENFSGMVKRIRPSNELS